MRPLGRHHQTLPRRRCPRQLAPVRDSAQDESRRAVTLSEARIQENARRPADLYASGCSVLVAVTFPDQVVL
jgi:hypothetical protein